MWCYLGDKIFMPNVLSMILLASGLNGRKEIYHNNLNDLIKGGEVEEAWG